MHVFGLTPADLRGLCLPSVKTQERARSWQQRPQWFSGWGAHRSEVVDMRVDAGQDTVAGCSGRGGGGWGDDQS